MGGIQSHELINLQILGKTDPTEDGCIILKQILETKAVTMLTRLILFGQSSMLNTSEHDDNSSGFIKTEFLEVG
jgi:hypothetical protein